MERLSIWPSGSPAGYEQHAWDIQISFKVLQHFVETRFHPVNGLFTTGADQGGHRAASQPVQLCLLSVHLLGAWRAHCGSSNGQSRQTFPSEPRGPVHCPVWPLQGEKKKLLGCFKLKLMLMLFLVTFIWKLTPIQHPFLCAGLCCTCDRWVSGVYIRRSVGNRSVGSPVCWEWTFTLGVRCIRGQDPDASWQVCMSCVALTEKRRLLHLPNFDCCLSKVEWGVSQNRAVDFHPGTEWAGRVLVCRAASWKRHQHRGSLPTPAGQRKNMKTFPFGQTGCNTSQHTAQRILTNYVNMNGHVHVEM